LTGIPIEMRVINQFKISSLDEWAIPRQKAVRIKNERYRMLNLMNNQIDKLRDMA
jgi:hypothetical protein